MGLRIIQFYKPGQFSRFRVNTLLKFVKDKLSFHLKQQLTFNCCVLVRKMGDTRGDIYFNMGF